MIPITFFAIVASVAFSRAASPIPAKEDWRQFATDLSAATAPDDLLLFSNPDPWVSSGTWYMGLRYYTPNFAHPWLILTTPPNPKLLAQLQSRTHIWIIGIHPRFMARHLLPNWQPQLVLTTSAGQALRLFPPDAAPKIPAP